jgi:hypothetical protein
MDLSAKEGGILGSEYEVSYEPTGQHASRMRVHQEGCEAAITYLQKRATGGSSWDDSLLHPLRGKYQQTLADGVEALRRISDMIGGTGDAVHVSLARSAVGEAIGVDQARKLGEGLA